MTDNARGVSAVASWFAFRVRANHERAVVLRAKLRRIEAYTPELTERARWSDRCKETRRPLFPGYIFARCSPEQLQTLFCMWGVVGALPSNLLPTPVSDADMATVRQLEACGLAIEQAAHEPGAKVRIRRGPLAAIEGVVLRGGRRLVVNIESFGGRAVAVELDAADLW